MRSSSRAEPWLRIVLCSAWLASAAQAQAQDDRDALRVVLSAPADGDCIDEAELSARVAERLGRRAGSDGGAVRVRVQLTRAQGERGWQAVLTAQTSAARERRIDTASSSCRELDDALVLVLAALVGVALPGEGPEPEVAPEPPPEPPPEPSREPAHSLEQHPSAESDAFNAERMARARAVRRAVYPLSWSFAAAAALTTGRLPGLGWGVSAALQLEWRSLTLVLGPLAFPAASADLGAGATAHFSSVAGVLRVCGSLWSSTWLRAALCVGAASGAVYVRSAGLAHNAATWSPSADGDLGLRLSGRVARKVRWLIQISGALPITRTRFVFDESGGQRRVYHRARAGVLLEVGGIIGGSS